MPFLQTKTKNPFGFLPAQSEQGTAPVGVYLVSSSEGQISIGDIVVASSVAQVKAASGAWSTGIVGVAAGTLLANAGSTAATVQVNSSQLLLVYDHPDQVFVGIDTSSGAFITVADVGKTLPVLTTGEAGSTGINPLLNRSIQALGAPSTVATLPFKLIGLHPIDGNTSSGTVRKWLLQVNTPQRATNFVTVTT